MLILDPVLMTHRRKPVFCDFKFHARRNHRQKSGSSERALPNAKVIVDNIAVKDVTSGCLIANLSLFCVCLVELAEALQQLTAPSNHESFCHGDPSFLEGSHRNMPAKTSEKWSFHEEHLLKTRNISIIELIGRVSPLLSKGNEEAKKEKEPIPACRHLVFFFVC